MTMRAFVVFVAFSPLLAAVADATVMRPLTLDELACRADVVVRGRVDSVRGVVAGEGSPSPIETRVVIAVDRSMRGHEQGSVVLREPGGDHDGETVRVHGAPSYRPGDGVWLFAAHRGGALRTVGMAQGAFFVVNGMVAQRLGELAFDRPFDPWRGSEPAFVDRLEESLRRCSQ